MKAFHFIGILCAVTAWLLWIGLALLKYLGADGPDSPQIFMLGLSVGILGTPIAREILTWSVK